MKFVCIKCGKDFEKEYNKGRKPTKCDKCKGIILKREIEEIKEKKTIENILKEILEILSEIDAKRIKLCNIAIELQKEQSKYDIYDNEKEHQIERNDFQNDKEKIQLINEWHENKQKRRNVKETLFLLRKVITQIPEKLKYQTIIDIQNREVKKWKEQKTR